MTNLNITPASELQAMYVGEGGPAVIDAALIRSLLDNADAAHEAAEKIADREVADAIRSLASGLNDAGVLLLNVASAVHRGNVAVVNYPDAL